MKKIYVLNDIFLQEKHAEEIWEVMYGDGDIDNIGHYVCSVFAFSTYEKAKAYADELVKNKHGYSIDLVEVDDHSGSCSLHELNRSIKNV